MLGCSGHIWHWLLVELCKSLSFRVHGTPGNIFWKQIYTSADWHVLRCHLAVVTVLAWGVEVVIASPLSAGIWNLWRGCNRKGGLLKTKNNQLEPWGLVRQLAGHDLPVSANKLDCWCGLELHRQHLLPGYHTQIHPAKRLWAWIFSISQELKKSFPASTLTRAMFLSVWDFLADGGIFTSSFGCYPRRGGLISYLLLLVLLP